MKKDLIKKKLLSVHCWYCKINQAEVGNAYCTFCREQMAKGNIKYTLFKK